MSKQEYAQLVRLHWEEHVWESELMHMNDSFWSKEGEEGHTTGTVVQLDL